MDSTNSTFEAVRACAIAFLAGKILQVDDVSAGNGIVITWRTVRSGETLQVGADAFDTAQLFVAIAGPEAALRAVALDRDIEPAPPVRVAPRVHAFAQTANGGRRRTFDVGDFTVVVEPHEDDAAQARFTERLAALCAGEDAAAEALARWEEDPAPPSTVRVGWVSAGAAP